VVLVALLVSAGASLSYLLYDSPLAPLLVAGLVAAAAILLAWLRRPVLALYAAVLVTLLPSGLIPTQFHSALNRSLTLLALGLWALSTIAGRRRMTWTSSMTLMALFLLWGLLTLFWASDVRTGQDLLIRYILRLALFLFLILNEIRTWATLRGLMYTLALAGWIFVAVGIGTVLTTGYTLGTRLQVLATNQNATGDLLALGMIGVLWLALESASRWRVLLGLAYLFLSLVLVAMSGSRGGAITWGTIMVAFLLWRPTRRWGLAGLLMLGATILGGSTLFATTRDRFLGRTGETPLGGREALWQAAWLLIREHPWRGVGIGNASREVLPYARLFRSMWGIESASLHNPVLTIWAETGIPGLLLYLGVLAAIVRSFARQYLRARAQGREDLLAYCALVGSVFLGHIAGWLKGGGAESSYSYFLMLGLLLIPAYLRAETASNDKEALPAGQEQRGAGVLPHGARQPR
jgi:O-antigen ligase